MKGKFDRITPLPNGVRATILEKGNTYLAVLELDPSEYAPHQTLNAYFMRIDGQTRYAPHHYVEALFKKIKYPNIEVYLKLLSPGIASYPITFNVNVQLLFF